MNTDRLIVDIVTAVTGGVVVSVVHVDEVEVNCGVWTQRWHLGNCVWNACNSDIGSLFLPLAATLDSVVSLPRKER